MRAKTIQGTTLKRLATKYSNACVERSWKGYRPIEEHEKIERDYKNARDNLFYAIDQLTSVNLTPRALEDMF